jgi:hypothetical protein
MRNILARLAAAGALTAAMTVGIATVTASSASAQPTIIGAPERGVSAWFTAEDVKAASDDNAVVEDFCRTITTAAPSVGNEIDFHWCYMFVRDCSDLVAPDKRPMELIFQWWQTQCIRH